MGYTYYGDLLGISGYYRLSPKRAYDRLNDFYNTTFSCLSDYCRNRHDIKVNMFSDSLLIWGDDEGEILKHLLKLYYRLSKKGLLLRGAIVKGKLDFEPRITLENFEKRLPMKDTLARAAGLEKTQKGARLLIENSLAEALLKDFTDWMTHEGYLQNIHPNISLDDIRRRICPTRDNKTYELLYFWVPRNSPLNNDDETATIKEQLTELTTLLTDDISVHHKETLKLFKRCKQRQEYTERRIGSNNSEET